jgi:ribose 5-phosphate isomerase
MIAVRKKRGEKGKKVLQTALQLGTGETVKRLVLKVDQYQQAEERICTVTGIHSTTRYCIPQRGHIAIKSFANRSP